MIIATCKHEHKKRNGVTATGEIRWRCKDCGKSWTDITPTVLDWCGVKPEPVGKKAYEIPGRSVLQAMLSAFRDRPPRLDAALLSDHWRHDLGLDQEGQLTPRQDGLLDWARLDHWR